jgi:hypothetical protein
MTGPFLDRLYITRYSFMVDSVTVAMEHVRELVRKSGKPIYKMAADTGLSENKIGYYLKPSSRVRHIPSVETLNEIAAAVGCTPRALFEAFAKDLGYPWN